MANPDFDSLLNTLAPFAKQMLSKHGEFYPFGATMTPDGRITAQAGYDGNEQPESQVVIDLLTDGFRRQAAAGQIRAAGLCIDIRTIAPGQTEKTDALCFKLEHQTGEALTACMPYKHEDCSEDINMRRCLSHATHRSLDLFPVQEQPNRCAPAKRRPAKQADGSGKFVFDRCNRVAFPAAVAGCQWSSLTRSNSTRIPARG